MKRLFRFGAVLILWVIALMAWMVADFPQLTLFLLLVHFVELLWIGYQTGKKFGIGSGKNILMNMIFGFVWWLPLRQQMQAETFTDADFVRED